MQSKISLYPKAASTIDTGMLQSIRLRRLGVRGATANLIAAIAYGEPSEAWCFTAVEITKQEGHPDV